MRAPSSRTRKIVGFAAGPLAVLAAGAMVWQGSSAAFTASTETKNDWTAGLITLTDASPASATFTVAGLAPGDTGSKCITVQATSDLNVQGNLYASVSNVVNPTEGTTPRLAENLSLTVQRGTFTDEQCTNPLSSGTDVTGVYSGVLSTLAGNGAVLDRDDVPNGRTEVKYKITYDFAPGAGVDQNKLMSQSVTADLVWELKAGTGA